MFDRRECLISLNEDPQHSPDSKSDELRCHRFCPRCPRQPPTIASFFPTADVANARFDNDLSEDLIRGSLLWIRRVLVRAQEGQFPQRPRTFRGRWCFTPAPLSLS